MESNFLLLSIPRNRLVFHSSIFIEDPVSPKVRFRVLNYCTCYNIYFLTYRKFPLWFLSPQCTQLATLNRLHYKQKFKNGLRSILLSQYPPPLHFCRYPLTLVRVCRMIPTIDFKKMTILLEIIFTYSLFSNAFSSD